MGRFSSFLKEIFSGIFSNNENRQSRRHRSRRGRHRRRYSFQHDERPHRRSDRNANVRRHHSAHAAPGGRHRMAVWNDMREQERDLGEFNVSHFSHRRSRRRHRWGHQATNRYYTTCTWDDSSKKKKNAINTYPPPESQNLKWFGMKPVRNAILITHHIDKFPAGTQTTSMCRIAPMIVNPSLYF